MQPGTHTSGCMQPGTHAVTLIFPIQEWHSFPRGSLCVSPWPPAKLLAGQTPPTSYPAVSLRAFLLNSIMGYKWPHSLIQFKAALSQGSFEASMELAPTPGGLSWATYFPGSLVKYLADLPFSVPITDQLPFNCSMPKPPLFSTAPLGFHFPMPCSKWSQSLRKHCAGPCLLTLLSQTGPLPHWAGTSLRGPLLLHERGTGWGQHLPFCSACLSWVKSLLFEQAGEREVRSLMIWYLLCLGKSIYLTNRGWQKKKTQISWPHLPATLS